MADDYAVMTVKLPASKKKVAKILAVMLDTTLEKLGGEAVEKRLSDEPTEFEDAVTQLTVAARARAGIAAPAEKLN
jgi:hypothetical protein